MRTWPRRSVVGMLVLAAGALSLPGCGARRFDAAKATRPYPADLHRAQTVDLQVFRDGTSIELHNSTARSYRQFDLWLNQRYVRPVEALPAGGHVRLSLWEFWDERGEGLNAGGLFRTYPATPIRLAEIQVDDHSLLVGLVAIPSKDDE